MRQIWRVVVCAAAAACGREPLGGTRPEPPSIDASTSAASPYNVLSAIVTARVRRADSVLVRLRPADASSEAETSTPPIGVVGDAATLPVLGLLADTDYHLRLVAYGPGGTTVGETMEFTTGALPSDLPRYRASGSDPSPGFVVFAAGPYGIVIDNDGRVVWYRRFQFGPGINFMAQPTGRYAARPPPMDTTGRGDWVEIDPAGAVTRTMGCARGLQPRFHDLISRPDGSYFVMCDETRTVDLSAAGGVSAAAVTGTVVQQISADGAVLFDWSPFDHLPISDLDPALRSGAAVNWTHGNSLDLDRDGNLLVSFRNLMEVTKIDTRTGEVIWRLGGRGNQFDLQGVAAPAFRGQHSVRGYAPGAVVLLDNLGTPGESRVERYQLDETALSARLLGSHGSSPRVVTELGGSVQDLPGGRTLVSFGTAGRVEEHDAAGRVAWRIEGSAGYVFRAQRIRSLYSPGVGSAR